MNNSDSPSTNSPFFSVVMTTYNRADIMERAVLSVFGQTFTDYELIIVDDCSTDHTAEKIRSLQSRDSRIVSLILDKNQGVSGARNRGLERSRSPYIVFIDDDDETLPGWLTSFYQKIPSLPESWGVLYSRYLIKEELTGIVYPNIDPPKEGHIFEDLIRGAHLPVGIPGTVIKRDALAKVGGFDEELRGLEDYDLWFRLSRDWTFHFLNIPSILVYEHSGFRNSEEANTASDVKDRFLEKWQADIVRFGGEFLPRVREQKESAGRLFARIRKETHSKGRLAGLRLLRVSIKRSNFLVAYFLKDIFLILIGPTLYDHVRRIRGNLYWRFYRVSE